MGLRKFSWLSLVGYATFSFAIGGLLVFAGGYIASINVASIAIRFNASQAVIRNVMNMVCKGVAYAVKKWIKSNL